MLATGQCPRPFTVTCFSTLPSQSLSQRALFHTQVVCHKAVTRTLQPSLSTLILEASGRCSLPHQAMSLATSDTVASVAELLDRVRACIGNVSPGTWYL